MFCSMLSHLAKNIYIYIYIPCVTHASKASGPERSRASCCKSLLWAFTAKRRREERHLPSWCFLWSCITNPPVQKKVLFFYKRSRKRRKAIAPPAPPKTQCWANHFLILQAAGQKSKPVQHCISGGWGRRGCVKKQYLFLDTRVRLVDHVVCIRTCIRTYTYTFTYTSTYTCTHIDPATREEAEPMCFCGRRWRRHWNLRVFVEDAEEDAKTIVFLWKTHKGRKNIT